jgi:hypothetical protein
MPRSIIAISLDESTLERLDTLVKQPAFPSRSQSIRRQWRKHTADVNNMAGISSVLTPESFRMLKSLPASRTAPEITSATSVRAGR